MDKAKLRRELLDRRAQISADERERRSALLVDQLAAWIEALGVDRIGLYMPIRSEPDLRLLPARLPQRRWGLPVVDAVGGGMHFHEWPDAARNPAESVVGLKPNRFGIPEPVDAPRMELQEHDLLIVPCLAVDMHGVRLGYGGGYYDRYLATHGVQTVGVVFAEFCLPRLPRHDHDRVLDWILTESGPKASTP